MTKDPDLRYAKGESGTPVGRYTLAVTRRFKQEKGSDADYISCVVFGKAAEFAEKHFKKGMRIAISGRIQTGSYEDKDGKRVYTTDVVIEEQEWAQSKNETNEDAVKRATQEPSPESGDGFMNIPDGVDIDELPFT